MDWKEIDEKIVQDDQNKWDRRVSARQLEVSQGGKLKLLEPEPEGEEGYALSDLATSQMCQRLAIPVDYYRRLPGLMKAMVANYDLHRLEENVFLLRGKGDWVRAFLSGEYTPYNNSQIAETVNGLLGQGPIWIKNFILEETNMFMKFVTEDLADPASGLKAGVMIGNSEVGLGSISVEPFVFRLACTNDLVVAQEKIFRHAHIHLRVTELTRRIAEAISEGFHVATSVLDRFLKAREEPVSDPVETIRKLAEVRKLSQKFTDEVVSSYQAEPEPTRFGVINAFTAAARNLAPLQKIEMERFAGTLLPARP